MIRRTGGGGGGGGGGGWKEGLQYMSRGVTSEMIIIVLWPHQLLFRKSGTAACTVHKKCYGVRRTCRSVSVAYALRERTRLLLDLCNF